MARLAAIACLLLGCSAAPPPPRPTAPPAPPPEPTTTLRYEVHVDKGESPSTLLSYPRFVSNRKGLADALADAFIPGLVAGRSEFVHEYRAVLADKTDPNVESWEYSYVCDPHLVRPTVVSMLCLGGEFTGGAHGMPFSEGMTFVIDDRTVTAVKLDDLFLDPASARAFVGATTSSRKTRNT